jgi:hypothetical protein
MRSSQPTPANQPRTGGLPQIDWDQYGLILLIWWVSALLRVKRGGNPNVPFAIKQLKQIISDAFNLGLIHELAG